MKHDQLRPALSRRMRTPRYHINVFYSRKDKGFIADIPDLRYCSAHGRTPEEAVREVMIAQRAWLRTARRHKESVPKPWYRSAVSGEFTARPPKRPKTSQQVAKMMRTGEGIDAAVKRAVRAAVKRTHR